MFLKDAERSPYTDLNLVKTGGSRSGITFAGSFCSDMGMTRSPVPKGFERFDVAKGFTGWVSSLNEANGLGPENRFVAIDFWSSDFPSGMAMKGGRLPGGMNGGCCPLYSYSCSWCGCASAPPFFNY